MYNSDDTGVFKTLLSTIFCIIATLAFHALWLAILFDLSSKVVIIAVSASVITLAAVLLVLSLVRLRRKR